MPPNDTAETFEKGEGSTPDTPYSHLVDPYRQIVFPNNIRQIRRERGLVKLLALSEQLPDIPYIRLSKIERGEVFAKPGELELIAKGLGIDPHQLLIDIDDPAFNFGHWAGSTVVDNSADIAEEAFAVLLAATIRHKRETNPRLSIATLTKEYGIPPVILSRLENAFKTLHRWNNQTVGAICHLLEVADISALRRYVLRLQHSGALNPYLDLISNPAHRLAKTRVRIAALHENLGGKPKRKLPPMLAAVASELSQRPINEGPPLALAPASDNGFARVRMVPVYGVPINDGLIRRVLQDMTVEAPVSAGDLSYGLRVCRPSLGPGLPGSAIVVVDPDHFPSSGGLAVLEEDDDAFRLLMVTFGRDGRMFGYSEHPNREIAIDDIDPSRISAVISARFN